MCIKLKIWQEQKALKIYKSKYCIFEQIKALTTFIKIRHEFSWKKNRYFINFAYSRRLHNKLSSRVRTSRNRFRVTILVGLQWVTYFQWYYICTTHNIYEINVAQNNGIHFMSCMTISLIYNSSTRLEVKMLEIRLGNNDIL